VNRTIATLAAVVALTLAACSSGTIPTTTTTDTRGWSDEAFRDVMAYCQAANYSRSCADLVTFLRDQGKCSLEATYRLVDLFAGSTPSPNDTPREAINDLRDKLHPAGDCLGYTPDE